MDVPPRTEFDDYAADYQRYLNGGRDTHPSGETMDYFCRGRVAWLAADLRRRAHAPARILDFGCGIGHATVALRRMFPDSEVLGVDVSSKSLEIARGAHAATWVGFALLSDFRARGNYDVVHCNGVFHHIPAPERAQTMRTVFEAARAGGYFSLWENSPWHPIVRYSMKRAEIDKDAAMVWPKTARGLCRRAGFRVLSTRFLFVFPRFLEHLRFMEPWVSPVPLGGQYHVLCRKPTADA